MHNADMPATSPLLSGELERLTRGEPIARPVPQRDARGRLTRDLAGEWDWYYQLAPAERSHISRRYLKAGGVPLDVVTTMAGYDKVDDWADDFVAAVRASRDRRRATPVDVLELVSTGEIARALGVRASAVSNWRNRSIGLPLPLVELSCGPVWHWDEIRNWAENTGRLVYVEEETF